jgi:UTP-glucose-1-phosphate uridylyltransferase
MSPTILVLAAGLGTRYGGLKQIDPIGPNGETIIDYSVYDAIRAGFGRLVFVIQHYFEAAFKEKVSSKFDDLVEIAYAYQELDACLDGFELPRDRRKPWGTAHAILVAREVVREPFAVINADDYYGPNSFKIMARFLTRKDLSCHDYAMVGYTLRDTLSEYGSVCRGVCQCDGQMFLRTITECKKVEKTIDGVRYFDDNGAEHFLTGDEVVSMNLWGLQPPIFDHLSSCFRQFLEEHGNEKGPELLIPNVMDEMIESGGARVKVLRTDNVWFGITYRRDATIAARCIRKLINQGLYPENLWGKSWNIASNQ